MPTGTIKKPRTAEEHKRRIRRILTILDRTYPNATTELKYRDAWELLVATILSAQCTDKRVNEVTPGLFAKYPTVYDFAAASQAELARDIRPTGFYNNKAKALIGAAKKIVSDFGGQVPRTMEQMLTIPGCARKTANVVLGIAYGIPTGIAVDTHVQRVARRLDLSRQKDPEKIERDLMAIVPKNRWIKFSHQMILHGRYVCTARRPRCAECPLAGLCYAKDKTAERRP
ncbi:MAG: endonuclease III [Bryobacteraceae bacterium]